MTLFGKKYRILAAVPGSLGDSFAYLCIEGEDDPEGDTNYWSYANFDGPRLDSLWNVHLGKQDRNIDFQGQAIVDALYRYSDKAEVDEYLRKIMASVGPRWEREEEKRRAAERLFMDYQYLKNSQQK